MTDRELLQQALDVLEDVFEVNDWTTYNKTIEAIRTRLAQLEPEPMAWLCWEDKKNNLLADTVLSDKACTECFPVYTVPPQREWVGLTDEEYEEMAEQYVTNCYFDTLEYAKAIEAKLKEKNT